MKDLIKFEVGKIYIAVQDAGTYIHKIISRTAKTAKVADGTLNGEKFNWFNEVAKSKRISVENGVEVLKNYYAPVFANSEYVPIKIAPVVSIVDQMEEFEPFATPAKVSTPAEVIDKVTARLRLDEKGRVKICYNGKFSTCQMFANLQAQGLNFETSYGILLKAVLLGTTKTADAKIIDDSPNWSELPAEGGWGTRYWAKRNLQSVAMALLDGSFKIKNNYLKTAVTDIATVDKVLADIAAKRGLNIQKHNDKKTAPKAKTTAEKVSAEPVEVTIKARTVADAMKQKAQIDAAGGNYKVNIVIECL